jgi:hypothetical protein
MSTRLIATLLYLVLFEASVTRCTAKEKVVIKTTGQFAVAKGNLKVLDLRLEHVVLSDIRMERALFALAEGIASSTNRKVQFALLIENSQDPLDRIPKRDPKVRFEGSNVTLRQVIDSLCQQSGWSYARVPPGYAFTDDNHLFKPKLNGGKE